MLHRHGRVALLATIAALIMLPGSASAEVTRCNGLPVTQPGTEGPDVIVGTSGRDVIATFGGNDRVSAGPGDDVVCLGSGNDALNGGAGDDLLVAEAAPDGTDSFAGGSGIDSARYTLRTESLAVSLDDRPDDGSGDENDNIHADVENVTGGSGSNTLRGSAAANALTGGTANDVIEGGPGNDVLRGGADAGVDGADRFLGGSGRDTVSYAARTTGVRVFLDGVANDGTFPFGEGDNVGAGADVEHVIGGSGNDSFNARAFFGGVLFEGRDGDDGFTTFNGVLDTNNGGPGLDGCLDDPTDVRISCER